MNIELVEAVSALVFDARSRKAADVVLDGLRRNGVAAITADLDLPLLLAIEWRRRLKAETGAIDVTAGHGTNADALSEFIVERHIAIMLGREAHDRLNRLALGMTWYQKKWPPVPKRMQKWISVLESDLKTTGFASCRDAEKHLSRLRKEGLRVFRTLLRESNEIHAFDPLAL